MDKRKHPRFQARFDALMATGRREGVAVLTDISYSGARLEGASLQPEVGTKVCLYIFLQPVSPFELEGQVVRSDETSFAISYQLESAEVERLVDDVAALVCAF
ncbi:MAG: PilZ domain-containing protein [Myxococcales bacterium]|nr:PilZ domain-containing protein [Myxococcales bacterium]